MIGFKLFDQNFRCRNGFKYRVGHTYSTVQTPEVGSIGYHFCASLHDLYRISNYLGYAPERAAIVRADGQISHCVGIYSTNCISILREVSERDVRNMTAAGRIVVSDSEEYVWDVAACEWQPLEACRWHDDPDDCTADPLHGFRRAG